MKNYITIAVILSLSIACGKKGNDKRGELKKLKQQQIEIAGKITTLEKELASNGDSTLLVDNAKLVQIQAVQPGIFNHYVEVQGKVDGDENVNISPETAGAVAKVLMHVGQQVAKGTIIAELDNKVLIQTLAELQSSLEFASNMYQKQENLWKQKIGSEVQYLNSKNQKESLEKKIAIVKEQLEMTRIKSPVNGTLDALDLKLGQMVAPGMIVARAVNLSNMKVKAEVGESYASSIKTGNKVIVIFPDIHDSLVNRLTYAAKSINPTNRTFMVEAALTGKGDYHPNMVAVLKINDYNSLSSVFSVPVNTIQKFEDGGQFVMVANGNAAKKKPVKIGKVYNGLAEVISGLSLGDKVIIKGFQDLNEGDEIKF